MEPPEAPQAVSIGLRNCYVARFGHLWETSKASKAPKQLSKAFEPQNPPQQLAKASCLLCHGTSQGPQAVSIGLRNCYLARFQLPPEASQAVSIRLRNCYVARLEHSLRSFKSFKIPAAAFESLWTAKPSAAACEGVPPALPWNLPRPHKLFLLGFETATWHVFGYMYLFIYSFIHLFL